MNILVKSLSKYLFRRAAYRIMIGRYRDPQMPALGRFTRQDIKPVLTEIFTLADQLVPQARLSRLRKRGNRFNTVLGVYSLAAYRVMRQAGIPHERAIELFGDIGWQLYRIGVNLPLLFIRPFTRNPQTRLNFVLRAFLFFPFSEDPEGYHRTYWREKDHYCTDWHRCVVYDYFKDQGTEEEIEFFRKTWCLYDFALPRLIHPQGYYERPHTLSSGDPVCDMRWYGRKPGQSVHETPEK